MIPQYFGIVRCQYKYNGPQRLSALVMPIAVAQLRRPLLEVTLI